MISIIVIMSVFYYYLTANYYLLLTYYYLTYYLLFTIKILCGLLCFVMYYGDVKCIVVWFFFAALVPSFIISLWG